MDRLRPVMLGGTGSDVGKSLLATGLCRIFMQDGYSPAPFKAQNMALNSYPTPDGREIGRAQAVQAEAAGIDCCTDMNPLLLKPSGERMSQVVLNGLPIGNRDAYDYYRRDNREYLAGEVRLAFDRLASRYNPIVMEGAGSVAELNLQSTDLVNMSMAAHAGAAVILVADIDRGGVFASLYGSVQLQPPGYRKLIKGMIVNKFRGDMRLFDDGRRILEDICGIPVIGVVPYMTDIHVEAEDSVALSQNAVSARKGKINIAVIRLPHISNFTDFDRLSAEDDVNLYYTISPEEIRKADIVILPGTKSTISDLLYLREQGCDSAILSAYRGGSAVIGICGGYQMLGREINDPSCLEGSLSHVNGIGLLPVVTVISGDKLTVRREFRFGERSELLSGYEIHYGQTVVDEGFEPVVTYSDGGTDGCRIGQRCAGTYLH